MKYGHFLLCLLLVGCGVSNPRFGSREAKTEKQEKKQVGPRFTSKHIEEEKQEDDRKVNGDEVALRFSSAKPPAPKSEKPGEKEKKPPAPVRLDAVPSPSSEGVLNKQQMMDVILGYLGTPYEYGGESKSGIDCSAFTKQVYEQSVRLQLPRTTEDQFRRGSVVARDGLQFGDLIFFNTTGANPSHVGIYIGDDLFAHASEAFGVTISSLQSSYYRKRYTDARRVISN